MGEHEMQQGLIVSGFLFPPHEDAAVAVEPRGNALDNPPSSALAPHSFFGLFLAPRPDMRHIAAAAKPLADRFAVVALVEAQMLPPARSMGASAAGGCRALPQEASGRARWRRRSPEPSGTPRRSERIDRLTPSLPRSVGFLPVFFPAQRRLGHRAVDACQCQPMPRRRS